MLKKWMILILVLILAIPAGMAEEQKQKLIEAQEGETAAMQLFRPQPHRAADEPDDHGPL